MPDLSVADLVVPNPSTCDPPQVDLGLVNCSSGEARSSIDFLGETALLLDAPPTAAVVADLDGDGREEVVVAEGDRFQILGNRGDGVLHPNAALPLSIVATFVVAGDFDGDNDLDLAFAGGSRIEFHRNGGGCGFAPTKTVDVGMVISGLRGGALDGDRATDLAYTSESAGAMKPAQGVLYGRAGFEFPAPLPVGGPGSRTGLALADLDGDLLDDLVLVEGGTLAPGPLDGSVATGSELVILFAKKEGGVRADVQTVTVHNRVLGVDAADLDGDGAKDLVVRFRDPPGVGLPPDGVAVLHNNRSAAAPVTPSTSFALDGPALAAVAADFDHDARMDLVIASGGLAPLLVPVRKAGMQSGATTGAGRTVTRGVTALLALELDCNPYPDLVLLHGGALIGVMLSAR